MCLWFGLLYQFVLITLCTGVSIFFVILSQPCSFDLRTADKLFSNLRAQFTGDKTKSAALSHNFSEFTWGHWAVSPLASSLSKHFDEQPYDWVVFLDPNSVVDVKRLESFLKKHDAKVDHFFGYKLLDEQPTIIHHFRGFDSISKLPYPSFSAGFAFSCALFKKLANLPEEKKSAHVFAIDAKHELAALIKDSLDFELENAAEIFCLFPQANCAVTYLFPQYSVIEGCDGENIDRDEVYTAVKTYSEFHRSRVVVVKRTWANQLKYVDYFSDIEDQFIPTKTFGITNTERGHCAKTLAILKYYVNNLKNFPKNKWLIIADDDTLLSVSRLFRLLRCYSASEAIILGERYGFGFSADGTDGYDYPTGGAGMIFSKTAAKSIADSCVCPRADSPDDMILGSCARSLGIPIIHSPAFHQARSIDYAKAYITQIPPISFHKFEDIDPYEEYMGLLHEEIPTDPRHHTEL
ncbi:unnamed protein product, partial [Mesorhabditis belari]|uniref:N-acetylgalactosaminide beta-1,3-galactosyltransferase n=1 Tax=Mesorhabditis belari TaxID=2138241 RepID=A0AAF3EVT1_9BILA